MNRTKIEYLDFTWNPVVVAAVSVALLGMFVGREARLKGRKTAVNFATFSYLAFIENVSTSL